LREPAVHDGREHEGKEHAASPVRDLCLREVALLGALTVFIVWIGVQPSFFLDRMGR
jgi:NADH:ubiquinone oxidoreductase subunit 4 (subunit M)